MKRLMVLATMAGAFSCAAADQTLTYTAADKPATLGTGGELAFTYDGDTVTKIVSNVAKGDTVYLKGDTLAFGTDATIATAGLGDLVLKNAISGTDGLLVTNTSSAQLTMEWWGDNLLDTNAWTTVFANVDLDDIELVSSDEKTWNTEHSAGLSNPQMMYPFWEKRETVDGVKTMTAQLQCYIKASKPTASFDVMVKYVGIELKQDGANIAARVTTAGYIPTNSTFSITYVNSSIYQDDMEVLRSRWLADPDPAVNPMFNETPVKLPGATGYGYGVGQLTVRRRDVPSVGFTYSSARNMAFGGDLKIAANARARRMKVNGYTLASGDTSTVNVEGLWESGDYVGSFGVPVKGSGTFVIAAETLGHANPCDATVKNFLTSSAVNIDSVSSLKYSLYDLTNICEGAIMCGSSMTYNRGMNGNPLSYNIATPHYWRFYTNGPSSYATVQMQASNSTTMIRCTILKFEQSTYDVKVSAITNLACYTPLQTGTNNGEGYYGMDFEDPSVINMKGFYKSYKVNTSTTSANPFSVSNLVCQFSRAGEYSMTLNAANKNWKNGRLVVEGKPDGTRIFANINGLTRLPTNGVTEVRMGGTLNFNAGVGSQATVSQNNTAHIKVYRGGVMRTYPDVLSSDTKWACRRDQRIDLLGGEWLPSWMHKSNITLCYCYMNNVMFADGARVASDIPFWAGNKPSNEPGRWLVRGTSPSYIDSPVQFLGTGTTGVYKFPIDVDDVTGDSTTDFFMRKPITRYSSTSLSNIRVAKYGRGTMEIQDTVDVIHGIEIFGGAFKLAGSGLTDDSAQQFILSGGTLEAAEDTENVCGPLAIAERLGAIRLGEGAKLTFADSSAETWPTGKENRVTVYGFAEGAIRFGTSNAAVPRRLAFKLPDSNGSVGATLCVKSDGYLTAILPGTNIAIR